jgi:hypothetical protein
MHRDMPAPRYGEWRCHRRNERGRVLYRADSARYTGGDSRGSATCEEGRPYHATNPLTQMCSFTRLIFFSK